MLYIVFCIFILFFSSLLQMYALAVGTGTGRFFARILCSKEDCAASVR